jgi:hypothetical protein
MNKKNEKLTFESMVNQFLAIAQSMNDEVEINKVGVALRYAAAQVSAHEANSNSECLCCYKDDALEWYSNQFFEMFEQNVDALIED